MTLPLLARQTWIVTFPGIHFCNIPKLKGSFSKIHSKLEGSSVTLKRISLFLFLQSWRQTRGKINIVSSQSQSPSQSPSPLRHPPASLFVRPKFTELTHPNLELDPRHYPPVHVAPLISNKDQHVLFMETVSPTNPHLFISHWLTCYFALTPTISHLSASLETYVPSYWRRYPGHSPSSHWLSRSQWGPLKDFVPYTGPHAPVLKRHVLLLDQSFLCVVRPTIHTRVPILLAINSSTLSQFLAS